jgi:hypothetical protein
MYGLCPDPSILLVSSVTDDTKVYLVKDRKSVTLASAMLSFPSCTRYMPWRHKGGEEV